MGNWVLRDRKNVLRVFVCSERELAVSRVMAETGLSAEEAARKVERVNRGRANHYLQYSDGHQWTDARNYDLVVNTSATGIDGAVDLIVTAARLRQRAGGAGVLEC